MSKNEKIKKIINFKYIKKGKDTLQKKAVKALFAFLVLMIGCTMLSRAADSMTIPRIKVDTPKSKTIVDEVKAKGVVAKNREEKISVVEGLKIDYVNISVGSSIKVGDTLVEFDMNAIKNEGYELITPVIITNTMEYLEIVPKDIKSVNTGETLITIL
mgnify:CR=1 FL=1